MLDPNKIPTWKLGLEKGMVFHDGVIVELIEEVERLQRIIDQMSCCCSGCTKHNLNLCTKVEG